MKYNTVLRRNEKTLAIINTYELKPCYSMNDYIVIPEIRAGVTDHLTMLDVKYQLLLDSELQELLDPTLNN